MRLPPNHLIPDTALSEEVLKEAASRFSTPLFVFDSARLESDLASLKSSLPGSVEVLYSVKANPSLAVVAKFASLGVGLEICSLGELKALQGVGADPSRAVYVGPGKGVEEIGAALDCGVGLIVAESIGEVGRIETAASSRGVRCRVLLRVNPGSGHGDQHMGGATQFGMDPQDALSLLNARESFCSVHFAGIHGYMGTRLMDCELLLNNFRSMLAMASMLQLDSGLNFDTVDLGGGFGVPLYDGEGQIDEDALRRGFEALLSEYLTDFPHPCRFLVESGRFLTARAGVFLTKVVDVKSVAKRKFVVVDGGIHAIGGRDGYLGARVSPMAVLGCRAGEPTEVTVCGPLCTPADRIAARVLLPMPDPEDIIAVYVAGAYGATASAGFFLSRGFPAEAVYSSGRLTLARPAIGGDVLVEAQMDFVKGVR